MRLEDVQKLMDETAEAAAYQAELTEMLGQQLTAVDDQEVGCVAVAVAVGWGRPPHKRWLLHGHMYALTGRSMRAVDAPPAE